MALSWGEMSLQDTYAATGHLGAIHPHCLAQSWSRKSEQDDKWSFCLTAGTLCPANQERP